MKVKLIAKTIICDEELIKELNNSSPESLIMYCARVSNPANQTSSNTKLLNYCIENNHWSIFEQASFTFEIETSRAISAQILRHRSFSFQEFSQRYAPVTNFEKYQARRQDIKNRQNSIDDMSEDDKNWFKLVQVQLQDICDQTYKEALNRGIAKEQARMLLPMSASTKLYMTGNIRSWIHYLMVRCDETTQLEHREIANKIKELLSKELPIIGESLNWYKNN